MTWSFYQYMFAFSEPMKLHRLVLKSNWKVKVFNLNSSWLLTGAISRCSDKETKWNLNSTLTSGLIGAAPQAIVWTRPPSCSWTNFKTFLSQNVSLVTIPWNITLFKIPVGFWNTVIHFEKTPFTELVILPTIFRFTKWIIGKVYIMSHIHYES